jgi:protein SCO1
MVARQNGSSSLGELRLQSRWGLPRYIVLLLIVSLALISPGHAFAHDAMPHNSAVLELVGFDQRLDAEVPLDLVFRDEKNEPVSLRYYLQDKPVVLALTYFECENLCPMVRHGLVESLRPLAFTVGQEFDVVVVSIDPDETSAIAATVKQETVAEYDRPGSEAGWHFLTGDHESIDQLADAIGFRFAYDGEIDEYAHPSGLVLLTPAGKIARYFFGIEYPAQELRLSLVDASQNQIGTAVDRLLLLCYQYDPTTGKYTLLIMTIVRTVSAITVVVIGMFLFIAWRKESHQTPTLG